MAEEKKRKKSPRSQKSAAGKMGGSSSEGRTGRKRGVRRISLEKKEKGVGVRSGTVPILLMRPLGNRRNIGGRLAKTPADRRSYRSSGEEKGHQQEHRA